MPKKFGVNTKAQEARERKDSQKKEKQEKDKKAKEDALWEETDKKVLAKMERKKEEEAKKQQAIAKRAEKKALEEKENEDLKKLGKATDTKLTRAMMEEQRLREQEEERRRREREKQKEELQIEENVNHLLIRQREEYLASGEDVIDARSVGEAISALGVSDGPVDKHPEKRLKAAFLAYESERLPILRKENPSLKLSQVKELLWREWTQQLKHP